MRIRPLSRRAWLLAGMAVLATAALAVLVANFLGGEKKIERRVDAAYKIEDPRFARELGVLLGPPFVAGNQTQVLLNGDEIFPSMLAAIGDARESITFETYIYWSGDIGRAFAAALAKKARDGVWIHVLLDWVGSGSESMQLMYLLTITAAVRSIDLSAAYFIPDELTLRALTEAIGRGVRIRVVVPGEHIDSETVRSASRARWGSLLAAGAVIAEYQPTMYHCKVMIVDGLLVSVGSTNFDNRSFRLNDEATLNVISREFAAQQTRIFEADLAKARPISFEQWSRRPVREKAAEWLSSILSSQL